MRCVHRRSCTRLRSQAWYDNRADDLTKEGMLKGVEESAAFVVFLSTGILQRPYCQMEIRHALALKKPVVLLHEVKRGIVSSTSWHSLSLTRFRLFCRRMFATEPLISERRTTRRRPTCKSCSTLTSPW